MHLRNILLAMTATGFLLSHPMAAHAQDVIGRGSPFPAALYAKWTALAKTEAGLSVTFDSRGGAAIGQSLILSRDADFAVAGMPMPKEMREEGHILQFPVIVGAVATVYNIPGVASGQLRLNGALLARIFTGGIKKWNDPTIVAVNSGVALPDMEIKPVWIRDAGVGATYGFTQYVLAANPEWRERHGAIVTRNNWAVGSAVLSAGDMVEVIKVMPGSIGYATYGLAVSGNIAMAALLNPAGQYVAPSLATIAAAAENADWTKAQDLVMTLVNQPGANTFPVAQTSYAQIPMDPRDMGRSQVVRKFFDFAYSRGSAVTGEFGFVPLPKAVQDRVRAAWGRVGS